MKFDRNFTNMVRNDGICRIFRVGGRPRKNPVQKPGPGPSAHPLPGVEVLVAVVGPSPERGERKKPKRAQLSSRAIHGFPERRGKLVDNYPTTKNEFKISKSPLRAKA